MKGLGNQRALLSARLYHVEHLLVARRQVRCVTRGLDGVCAVEVVGRELLVELHEVTLYALAQTLHVAGRAVRGGDKADECCRRGASAKQGGKADE